MAHRVNTELFIIFVISKFEPVSKIQIDDEHCSGWL